jgi:RNA polymerase sigma factor (sigma-70 family)
LTAPPAAAIEPDEALLGRYVQNGDEPSFSALVARHGPMVLRLCRRLLGDLHAAEDCFQTAFLILARRAGSVRRPQALAAWLHAVALRVALKARARRQGAQASVPDLPDPHPDPLAEVTARDLLAAVDEEVRRLPEAYRLPVILCCLEGLTQEEAAQRLGCTAGSVKGRLERGRQRLHDQLARRGLTLSAALAAVELSRGAATAVPVALASAAVRTALTVEAGDAGAAALARGAASFKLKAGILLGLALGAAALGAGLLAQPGPPEQPAGKKKEGGDGQPAKADEGRRPRTDLHGDPLPEGVIARLGTLRFRGVRGCLAFAPDGKQVAAATEPAGAEITLFDTTSGRAGRRFPTRATLTRVAFAPDGKRIACSDNSAGSQVFDVASGKALFNARGSHAAFADGGKVVVTADGYGTAPQIHAWDAASGRLLREWPTGKVRDPANAFNQGAEQMAVASAAPVLALIDRSAADTVQIRDLTTGATIRSIRVAPVGRTWLALAPDGKTLATASQTAVRLWDIATEKEVRSWRQRADGPPVFWQDGKRLAWTGFDQRKGIACVWTAARTSETPRTVGAPVNTFEPPSFSPDGSVLAVVIEGHAMQLRRIADGKEVKPLDAHEGSVYGLAFTADGAHVVSGARTGLLGWEARTGKLLHRSPPGDFYSERVVSLLPDGRLLTADPRPDPTRGVFRLRDPLTGRELLRVPGRPDVGEVVVAPGGRYAGLGGERDGGFSVLDLRTGRWRYRLDPREAHHGPKLSADGDLLVWHRRVADGFDVHVRRHTTGKATVLTRLPQSADLARLSLSPDGRWLVLPGEDGRLRRWDLGAGKEAPALAETQRTVWAVTWSPDSRVVLASGSAAARGVIDREARRDVRAWDAVTGRRLKHLDLTGAPQSLLFSPDSCTLLSGDREEIQLREVATGQERTRLRGHAAAWVTVLAVSADGRLLASGGDDAQVLVWDLTGRAPDGRWHTARLRPEQLTAGWEALAGANARAAYAALWQLAADPDATTTLLRQRLKPAPVADAAQLGRLIKELESGKFTVRERAGAELARLGEMAEPALRKVVEGKPSEELRRRVLKLLERLEGVPAPEQLRALRAVELLERIGTPEARRELERLAGGAPEARLTRVARAALERLAVR